MVGEPMITLVLTDDQHKDFLTAHWPHVSPDMFVPHEDANASFEVTPQEFSLHLHLDDGGSEEFEAEHHAPEWAAECLRVGRILVFVAPPGLDVDNINDRSLVEEAQHGKLFGLHVPVNP